MPFISHINNIISTFQAWRHQETHKLKSKVNATLPVDPALRGLEDLAARKAQRDPAGAMVKIMVNPMVNGGKSYA